MCGDTYLSVSMLGYKLDKEYPEIIKVLDERKNATVEAE